MPTSLTPAEIARRVRIAEEDSNYVNDPNMALLAPLMVYGGALGPEIAGALGNVGRAAPLAAETVNPGISAAEMAVIRSKYPGRHLNPQTGFPQSAKNAFGKAEPAMGATTDPYPAMWEYLTNAPSAVTRYLTKPNPIRNSETGYQVRNIPGTPQYNPNLPFGTPSTAWTPGQRLAQTGVGSAAVGVGAGAMGTRGDSASAGSTTPDYLSQFNQTAPNSFSPAEMETLKQIAINAVRGRQEFEQTAPEVGAGRGFVREGLNERADYYAKHPNVDREPSIGGAGSSSANPPMPSPRPEEFKQKGGLFSGFFKDPYEGMSPRDMFVRAQDMQRSGDEAGANVLTQRAMRAYKSPQDVENAGMASGGVAGKGNAAGGRDAALHKALEIIHHMMMNR